MDSPAVRVFRAGPYPVIHTFRIDDLGGEVELDVALLIDGIPTMIAASRFPLDDTWHRIHAALSSGDAHLGVVGVPYAAETPFGPPDVFPSAYVGLECANGERLILAYIRGRDPNQDAESFAQEVLIGIRHGRTPDELGDPIED